MRKVRHLVQENRKKKWQNKPQNVEGNKEKS